MSEAAFLVMDLTARNRSDLASRFLNAYLEITGDYGGLDILRFYLVVSRLGARQDSPHPRSSGGLARPPGNGTGYWDDTMSISGWRNDLA